MHDKKKLCISNYSGKEIKYIIGFRAAQSCKNICAAVMFSREDSAVYTAENIKFAAAVGISVKPGK